MTVGHRIAISPANAHVEVRVGDVLLGASDEALKLEETGLPPRYYLPRRDVRMDLLRRTTFHTSCPFKGEASYWSVDVDGVTYDGVVWSYETPKAEAAQIESMLSFYPDRTDIAVGGQPLKD